MNKNLFELIFCKKKLQIGDLMVVGYNCFGALLIHVLFCQSDTLDMQFSQIVGPQLVFCLESFALAVWNEKIYITFFDELYRSSCLSLPLDYETLSFFYLPVFLDGFDRLVVFEKEKFIMVMSFSKLTVNLFFGR